MKTIGIISQKGGSGKTTLALHLAVAAYQLAGLQTAIIDIDPQASSANWGDRREDELPVAISAQANRIPQTMADARNAGADFVLLDTAPHSDQVALKAIEAADFVLIPCRPALLDLEAVINTIDLVRLKKTPFAVVLNAVHHFGTEADDAAEVIAGLGDDVLMSPVRVGMRIAYARALTEGKGVTEVEGTGKAADEMRALLGFLNEHVHMFTAEQKGMTDGQQTRRRA